MNKIVKFPEKSHDFNAIIRSVEDFQAQEQKVLKDLNPYTRRVLGI